MTDALKMPGDPGWFEGNEQTTGITIDGKPIKNRFENVLPAPDEPPTLLDLEPEDTAVPAGELNGDEDGKVEFKLPPKLAANTVPAWFPKAMVPKGLRFPRGLTVTFFSIPADQTARKDRGDRFVIVWELNEADERLAHGRSMGDGVRGVNELAKQMVRGFDGMIPNWGGPGSPDSVDDFWRDIGAKGRGLLRRLYVQINQFDEAALTDFFEHRIACVPTG